jgi:hypothetical protein
MGQASTLTRGGLAAALVGLGALGCNDLTVERPLTVTQPLPDAGSSAATGAAGAGGGGTAGAAGTGSGGGPVDARCWAGQLPPEVQPILPTLTIAGACALGRTTTQWSSSGTSASSADGRADIVGRWASCGEGSSDVFSAVAHAGLEFGANGRWRLLASDGNGGLAPEDASASGVTGYYDLLASGQLDVVVDGVIGMMQGSFAAFAPGKDAMRLDVIGGTSPPSSIYARTKPAPLNGDDNPPSTSDGRCSMVGTWAVPANKPTPAAPALTMSFDAAGNFVGGPQGSDLCAAHTSYGTYALSPGWFQLVTNVGLGVCPWLDSAAYPATFDDSCAHVTLVQDWDNCTGGRGTFNGTTTLTRLQ